MKEKSLCLTRLFRDIEVIIERKSVKKSPS
jgi:hypothetical protein